MVAIKKLRDVFRCFDLGKKIPVELLEIRIKLAGFRGNEADSQRSQALVRIEIQHERWVNIIIHDFVPKQNLYQAAVAAAAAAAAFHIEIHGHCGPRGDRLALRCDSHAQVSTQLLLDELIDKRLAQD